MAYFRETRVLWIFRMRILLNSLGIQRENGPAGGAQAVQVVCNTVSSGGGQAAA